jgi:hypothetical protein
MIRSMCIEDVQVEFRADYHVEATESPAPQTPDDKASYRQNLLVAIRYQTFSLVWSV